MKGERHPIGCLFFVHAPPGADAGERGRADGLCIVQVIDHRRICAALALGIAVIARRGCEAL